MKKLIHYILPWAAGLLCGIAVMQLCAGEYLITAAWAMPLIGLSGVLIALPGIGRRCHPR